MKIGKGSNSVNTGDMVMVFAFCDFPRGPLSLYLVSFNSLVYFQAYAPILQKKEVTVNTIDRVMILKFYTLMALYQCIKFHSVSLYTFRDMLRTSLLLQT